MLKQIAVPFGMLLLWLDGWTGNYGVAVILFALVVKLIMLPFQLKSKKSMMRTSRMTPRLKELEKKFGNDKQRYQQEMNKLYKEEGINPMSGCLWTLIPFPILIALYQAIRYPLTIMMRVPEELLAEGGAITQKLAELGYSLASYSTGRNATVYEQIFQSQFITEHFAQFAGLSDKLQEMYYQFLGMNLGQVPKLLPWNWDPAILWCETGLFLIPIVSALLSWLSMKISTAGNPQQAAQNQQMQSMNIMMPLMSLWICFTMPGVLGIYWIAQSVFSIIQDLVLTRIFNKQLDIEDAERLEREKVRAAELEQKRLETERLKAEGKTIENRNTSKKKKQAVAAQKEAERKAAEIRAEREEKRRARGIVDDIPESQVGNRRYARGRAYVADRYTNPEEAEEKTLAAAEESADYDELAALEAAAETEDEILPEELAAEADDPAEELAEPELEELAEPIIEETVELEADELAEELPEESSEELAGDEPDEAAFDQAEANEEAFAESEELAAEEELPAESEE